MKDNLCKGKLIKWKDDQGFGFIQSTEGSQEIYIHILEIKDATRRPKVGDTIYYYVTGEGGKINAYSAFILGARSKTVVNRVNNKSTSDNSKQYPLPILEVLLLSILPLVGSIHFFSITNNILPLILYPSISLLTYFSYANDKSCAKRGDRRIPEKTLHFLELACGWPGGFIAQRLLHHKSSKRSYQAEFWAIVGFHLVFWLVWLLFGRALFR